MPTLSTQEHARNSALLRALDTAAGTSLDRIEQLPADSSWKLLEGEVDYALVSPLVFAKKEGDLALFDGACVAATGATGELYLQFRQGLRDITTVGYYGEPGIETMLAEVVLKEKYHMTPRFLPIKHDPADALTAVDAVLYTIGHPVQQLKGSATLDVIDEWFDMTQLPFVREVVIGWKGRMDADMDDAVRKAAEEVDAEVLIALDEQMRGRESSPGATASLPPHYRYRFTADSQEGLQLFFQMSFFHGLRGDIPNFTFWTEEIDTD